MKKPGFIDIHCHILPGVDDGAADIEMSVKMLESAYRDGVRHIIATPHYPEQYGNSEKLINIFEEFRNVTRDRCPEIEITLGNEIFGDRDSIQKLYNGQALTLAGSKFVLVEFLPIIQIRDVVNTVYSLISNGYIPIIAHPERYEAFRDIGAVRRVVDMGARLQVNTSLLVSKKPQKKQLIKKWLKEQLVEYVSSDSHNTTTRPTRMNEAYKCAERLCGSYYSDKLFYGNALKILTGDYGDEDDMFNF